jgi:hypothetical protein
LLPAGLPQTPLVGWPLPDALASPPESPRVLPSFASDWPTPEPDAAPEVFGGFDLPRIRAFDDMGGTNLSICQSAGDASEFGWPMATVGTSPRRPQQPQYLGWPSAALAPPEAIDASNILSGALEPPPQTLRITADYMAEAGSQRALTAGDVRTVDEGRCGVKRHVASAWPLPSLSLHGSPEAPGGRVTPILTSPEGVQRSLDVDVAPAGRCPALTRDTSLTLPGEAKLSSERKISHAVVSGAGDGVGVARTGGSFDKHDRHRSTLQRRDGIYIHSTRPCDSVGAPSGVFKLQKIPTQSVALQWNELRISIPPGGKVLQGVPQRRLGGVLPGVGCVH